MPGARWARCPIWWSTACCCANRRRSANFEPYLAGQELTLADCAAFVHLPLVSMATKLAYGGDALEGIAQLKPYLKMLAERPAFARVNEDRKIAQAAMYARAKK